MQMNKFYTLCIEFHFIVISCDSPYDHMSDFSLCFLYLSVSGASHLIGSQSDGAVRSYKL